MNRNCLLMILGLNLLCTPLQAQTLSIVGFTYDNECGPSNGNGICIASVNSTGFPPFQYQWSTGAIYASFEYSDTLWGVTGGNYSVTVTDNFGATGNASFQVPDLPSLDFAPVAIALPRPGTSTGAIRACTFGNPSPGPLTMTLYNNTTSQGWGPYNFSCGFPCGAIHNFMNLPAGNYVATLTNGNGCSGTFSIQLPELTVPVYSLTLTPGPACSGAANGTLTMNFTWQNGFPVSVDYFNSAFFGPLPTYVQQSFQYNLYNNAGNLIGQKYNLNDVFTGLSPGNYKLHVVYLFDIINFPVEISRDTFPVTIPSTPNPIPVVTTNGPVTFCSGGSVALTATATGGATFQWKKNGTLISGATSNSFTATSAGTYKVQKTNQYGCTGTSAGTAVSVLSLPTATATPQGPTTFCAGDSVVIKANYNPTFSYQWKKNNVNIVGASINKFTAKAAGNYKVKVTNVNGCTKMSNTVTVSVPCREGSQTGMQDMDVRVSPNPSNDCFNLTVNNSGDETLTIVVYDITGRVMKGVVQQMSLSEFIINGLLNGIYMAEVKQGTQKKITRLVKTN